MALVTTSYNRADPVVPDDAVNQPGEKLMQALYVGTGGDVSLVFGAAAAQLFKNVASGSVLLVSPKRVNNTGTTATDLLALFVI